MYQLTLSERAAKIRLAVFDVDGVMTDGSLYFDDDGREHKAFHSRDGHGLKMLKRAGIEIAIITGRNAEVVQHRAMDLGIEHLYQGVESKLEPFRIILTRLGVEPEQASYMGDDIIDLPILIRCGLAITVPDAPEEVQSRVHYVTRHPAGRGAVRESCELILRSQGHFEAMMRDYLAD
jgi:3-deoxy-D-manno-octulosonate 8-phosphate phosphatase (KDO 8-P phosphatase)